MHDAAALQFQARLVLETRLVTAIMIGLHWGGVGVSVGYTAATVLSEYPEPPFA